MGPDSLFRGRELSDCLEIQGGVGSLSRDCRSSLA